MEEIINSDISHKIVNSVNDNKNAIIIIMDCVY